MEEIVTLSRKTITLYRNELLQTAGNIDRNLYYVEAGSVRLFITENEEEQIVRFGYRGNLIVLLDSFLTNQPSLFYIQAIKKTSLKIITREQLDEFLTTKPDHFLWTKMLEDLALQQLEREIDLLTTSPRERYERVLKRSPKLFQEIPNKYIANYLRMTPETLSRLKKS